MSTDRLGFTGTQHGMTLRQVEAIAGLLAGWTAPAGFRGGELHHGDCIGADAQAHALARRYGARVVLHPPTDPSKRAFCEADIVRPAAPYLVRNRHIVDETESLVAAPLEPGEARRSGTWSTVRYARRLGREVVIVYLDGRVTFEHPAV